jgi:uncharacterized protein (DUF885 family)
MHDDNPLDRIGRLKGRMFRAGRCVVDTERKSGEAKIR